MQKKKNWDDVPISSWLGIFDYEEDIMIADEEVK